MSNLLADRQWLACDQFGNKHIVSGKYPCKALLEKLGYRSVEKIYRDAGPEGRSIHVGWRVGPYWFDVFELKPLAEASQMHLVKEHPGEWTVRTRSDIVFSGSKQACKGYMEREYRREVGLYSGTLISARDFALGGVERHGEWTTITREGGAYLVKRRPGAPGGRRFEGRPTLKEARELAARWSVPVCIPIASCSNDRTHGDTRTDATLYLTTDAGLCPRGALCYECAGKTVRELRNADPDSGWDLVPIIEPAGGKVPVGAAIPERWPKARREG